MSEAYYFSGITQSESLKVIFNSREEVYLASSKTNYKLKDVSNKFYDSIEEKERCLKLSDKEFVMYVIIQFGQKGYKFIKRENE